MAAGVHHIDFVSLVIHRAGLAGVRQPRLFLDRQRIEVRAHKNRRAVAIAQNAHDAVPADSGGDFETRLLQLLGDLLAGLFFVERQFGVCVQMAVEIEQPGYSRSTSDWTCSRNDAGGAPASCADRTDKTKHAPTKI